MEKPIGLPSLKEKTPKEKAKMDQSTSPKILLIPLSLSPEEAWEVFKRTFKIGKR